MAILKKGDLLKYLKEDLQESGPIASAIEKTYMIPQTRFSVTASGRSSNNSMEVSDVRMGVTPFQYGIYDPKLEPIPVNDTKVERLKELLVSKGEDIEDLINKLEKEEKRKKVKAKANKERKLIY